MAVAPSAPSFFPSSPSKISSTWSPCNTLWEQGHQCRRPSSRRSCGLRSTCPTCSATLTWLSEVSRIEEVEEPIKPVLTFASPSERREVLKSEAHAAGDLGAVVHRAYFRMDEMMRGQRGWRELQALGDKINQFSGIIEGLIWSPKASDSNDKHDDWAFEEVLQMHGLRSGLYRQTVKISSKG
ncbi:putative protein phosphatase 2C 21 [Zea mays]|uniref:Uncharacterized protein n=1 Tax=Zea mays TaxID=4577 RepID=A0A1D6QAK8_MAIZE|nr:putative protein phosphatase 2C 21 [Zea mays]